MKQIFPLIHLGCGVGSVFVNCLGVSQSWIDLWLQALFFSFQKYLTLPRYFGKGGLFVFMYFFCNLKASWIIKPVIFQACKCFQHVALFPESAHTVASWRTSVSPNHLSCCFPLGLWYLGCSFGKQTQKHVFLPILHTQGHGRNSARGEGECTTISEEKLQWPNNVFPWCWALAYIQPGAKVTPPAHISWETIREHSELQLKNSFLLWSQMFLQEAGGKNARVKLMKTSQNTALLWLIPPSWQVPKPRRRLRAWLSAPTELDLCVSCWELQARATHFLSILLKMIRPVLFITRSWKMTCKKGGKALCSQSGCLLNKCPPSSWTHHAGARPWGPYPSS